MTHNGRTLYGVSGMNGIDGIIRLVNGYFFASDMTLVNRVETPHRQKRYQDNPYHSTITWDIARADGTILDGFFVEYHKGYHRFLSR